MALSHTETFDFDMKRKLVDPFCTQLGLQLVKCTADDITVIDAIDKRETTVPMWFIKKIQRMHVRQILNIGLEPSICQP